MARPPEPIQHGTPPGYQKHIRRGVPHEVCGGACKRAWNEDQGKRRRKKGK